MRRKVCLVTGAASGIGQQLAISLARLGATVVAAARSRARVAHALQQIASAVGNAGRVEGLVCDVSSLESMRAAAAELTARHPQLHLLVNNAGVYSRERTVTDDGLELGFAVNALAPFVLSTVLSDAMKAAAPSRIVNVAMTPTEPIDFADPQAERRYSGLHVLKATKAGHHHLTYELSRRLIGTGVRVVTVDPGRTQSKLFASAPLPLRLALKLFGQEAQLAARGVLGACLDEKWRTGAFIGANGEEAATPAFVDAATSRRLWMINAALARLAVSPARPSPAVAIAMFPAKR